MHCTAVLQKLIICLEMKVKYWQMCVRSTAPPKDKDKWNGIDSYVRDIRKVSWHFSADLVILSTLYVFNSLDLMKFVFVVLLGFFFHFKGRTKKSTRNSNDTNKFASTINIVLITSVNLPTAFNIERGKPNETVRLCTLHNDRCSFQA